MILVPTPKLRISRLIAFAFAGAFLLSPQIIQAQQPWPSRPVTLIVPFSPGASNDTFTRAIANYLTKKHGQPFVVENRVGAAGFTGSSSVARAAPDGYTFLESPTSIASFKAGMKLDLDPSTDLETISVFARSSNALIVSGSVPAKNVKEFVDYAKKNPDTTFFAFTGIGTSGHIQSLQFNDATGLNVKGVSYKGGAEALNDLIAGRVHMMFISVASVMGQIQGGTLKLLAYATPNVSASAPKAPTLAEEGVKGMEQDVWWAMFAPKGTPRDILEKMNAGVAEAVREPELAKLIETSSAKATPTSLDQANREMKQEVEMIARLLKTYVKE